MTRAIIVVFHMKGCPHCPPALEAANGVKTAHVVYISSDHPAVQELGISSFPTIWLSLPSTLFDYGSNERSTSALEQYVTDKLLATEALRNEMS